MQYNKENKNIKPQHDVFYFCQTPFNFSFFYQYLVLVMQNILTPFNFSSFLSTFNFSYAKYFGRKFY